MKLKNVVIGLAGAVGIFATAATTPTQKDWTILVYLNGNNSLDSFGPINLNEMEQVGSTDRVNVVVEWGSYDARKVVRLLVQKDNDTTKVTSPILQDLGLKDMGSTDELVAFAKWGVENYPAKHYLLDIWNHGNGWQKNRTDMTPPVFRDVSWDDLSGNHITTEQLGGAMAQIKTIMGHNIDILGFDACLMAMAEIGAEVADSTDYLVGSEDLEPGDGWPYQDFLKAITVDSTAKDTNFVANALVQTYGLSYTNGSHGTENVTLSAFDLKALVNMYPALKNLSAAMATVSGTNAQALNTAIGNTQGFYGADYRDLGDLVLTLQTKNVGVDGAVLTAVAQQLKNNVVTSNHPTGTFLKAQGLSLWAPNSSSSWTQYGARYTGFKFDQATDWSKWIKNLSAFQSTLQ